VKKSYRLIFSFTLNLTESQNDFSKNYTLKLQQHHSVTVILYSQLLVFSILKNHDILLII